MDSIDLECSTHELPKQSLQINTNLAATETQESEAPPEEPEVQAPVTPVETKKKYFQTVSSSYLDIFLQEKNSDLLLSKFMHETSVLINSDASGRNFSFKASLERVMLGYHLYMFDYRTTQPIKVKLSADCHGIILKKPFSLEKQYSYKQFKGIVFGGQTSTFKIFSRTGNLNSLGIDWTDCFSFVSDLRNFEFATHSELAKYDIWQVCLGCICALSSNLSSVVPLSKHQMTIMKIRYKVQNMAAARNMNVKELFILAILKTLVQRNLPREATRVKKILNDSFSTSSKIFRMFKCTPWKKPTKVFYQNFHDNHRIHILGRRMGYALFEKDNERIKMLGNWTAIKRSTYIYTIDHVKSYLSRKTSRVPTGIYTDNAKESIKSKIIAAFK